MTDLIQKASHYNQGCSPIGRPIVWSMVGGCPDHSFELECKAFCYWVEDNHYQHQNRMHNFLAAIEYLWRCGLKEGVPALEDLRKAQERLKVCKLPEIDKLIQIAIDRELEKC